MMTRINDAVLGALNSELAHRRALYPRWVRDGRMTQQEATRQIDLLEQAIVIITNISAYRAHVRSLSDMIYEANATMFGLSSSIDDTVNDPSATAQWRTDWLKRATEVLEKLRVEGIRP